MEKNIKKYKICSYQYFDEYGIGDNPRYYIEYQKKTMFGTRWKRVKHLESISTCEVGKVTTYFESIYRCKKFIDEVLIPNKPKEKWVIKEEL